MGRLTTRQISGRTGWTGKRLARNILPMWIVLYLDNLNTAKQWLKHRMPVPRRRRNRPNRRKKKRRRSRKRKANVVDVRTKRSVRRIATHQATCGLVRCVLVVILFQRSAERASCLSASDWPHRGRWLSFQGNMCPFCVKVDKKCCLYWKWVHFCHSI